MSNEEAIRLLGRINCAGCEYYTPWGWESCTKCSEAGKLGAKAIEDVEGLQAKVKELEEHQQKYRWHDLRKEPKDLPETDVKVYVCYIPHPKANGHKGLKYGTDRYQLIGTTKHGTEIYVWGKGNRVVGWRYIEPFEEGEG